MEHETSEVALSFLGSSPLHRVPADGSEAGVFDGRHEEYGGRVH